MKRRSFLTAASLATGGMLLPIGCNSWVAQPTTNKPNNRKRLVVVFLRGAVDGLNIVIPHQAAEYYEARPTIAVPYPQQPNGTIDLDGFFGLHPQLKELIPFWQNKQLAFVHASGSPVLERSHFQAQDYLENGTPGVKNTPDGWLNRLLAQLPQDTPTQAINVGVTTPYILKGKMAIASLKPGKNSAAPIATDRPLIRAAFSKLYSGSDPLSKAYQTGSKARDIITAELGQEMSEASRGAKSVNAFVDDAAEVAKLMVGNAKTQLAFMEIGGWDTHVNQNPLLDRLLPSLGEGLATLAHGLKPIFADTVIVVMSEFGRTVRENGNKGTDHGYGNVMWLLGGPVRGGNVYGKWLGLDHSALYQNRDLPITTDFREVFSSILQQHLSVPGDRLNQVFPNFQLTNKIDFLV
ncbi:hypothetical protein C7B62_04770 [Pleurocapsa sp. CCALA 161]|uniref:DUF1501 domain-containing protein n=1 Tax=Pleurocapsa sp. CCALA 161 TaxID=2107688 RepID=UPI000D07530F|nr:DUF1501 domain-containing protein [Pleurocapsa sp. CCALA 161]PSB11709.1 hypothetical protein C7B62_04770 [Pleurocapsa sp. CCALA 161]